MMVAGQQAGSMQQRRAVRLDERAERRFVSQRADLHLPGRGGVRNRFHQCPGWYTIKNTITAKISPTMPPDAATRAVNVTTEPCC